MDNEVVIHVRADDDVDRGFASARTKAHKLGVDIDNEVRKVGPKIGQGLGGGMLSGLSGSLPGFAQFGGVAGAIMAPTLGAAVAAGVMGGAGGLGIIGGFAIASKDPAVKAAATSLKETIGEDLKSAASSFVPVALTSLGKLRQGFKDVLPDIRSIFETSSTFVDPLLDGMISGAKRIIGSIENLVSHARPVFESFGRTFDAVGDSVGNLFDSLADNADEGASAVDDLTSALTNTIDVTGRVINFLAEAKGGFDDLDAAIDKGRYFLEDHARFLDLTADGYKKGSEAAELYRKGLIGAAGSANDYNHYLEEQKKKQDAATSSTKKQTSALQELSDEMQKQTDPLFALIDGQQDVKRAQDAYNEALRKHGPRSSEARKALTDLGQAAFRLTDRVGDAAGGFNGRLTPAMRSALGNAGLTARQIDRLEGELRAAARAANNWEGTYEQTYKVYYKTYGNPNQAAGALNKDLERNRRGAYAHGGIKGAASGMIGSGMTLVGEHGPELVRLPPGSHVLSNPDTMHAIPQWLLNSGNIDSSPYSDSQSLSFAKAMLSALKAGKAVAEDFSWAGQSSEFDNDALRFGTVDSIKGLGSLSTWFKPGQSSATAQRLLSDYIRQHTPSSAAGGTASSGGVTEIVITFDPSHTDRITRAIMEGLRYQIRAQGGVVQHVLGDPTKG